MSDEKDAAVRTLSHLGYEWQGGESWRPPLGAAPAEPLGWSVGIEGRPAFRKLMKRSEDAQAYAHKLAGFGVKVSVQPLGPLVTSAVEPLA